MANHCYMSLSGIGKWDSALNQTLAQWTPYRRYIATAINAAEQRSPILGWRLPSAEEFDAIKQRVAKRPTFKNQSKRRRDRVEYSDSHIGEWIILEPRPGFEEEPDSTYDAFLDAREIHEREPQRRRRELIWDKRNKIAVLGRIHEQQALQIERLPLAVDSGDESAQALIYLKANTWPLVCQKNALEHLESYPSPRLEALVRLASTRADWESPIPRDLTEDQWFFLRSKEDGTLRDGTTEQRTFVKCALATPDFAVLEGPPGSGKTTAICELILQLTREGKRVLLVASTHVAVDNVLESLIGWQDEADQKWVMPLRIGDEDNIASTVVRPWALNRLVRTCKGEILDFLDEPGAGSHLGVNSRSLLGQALRSEKESTLANMMLESSNLVCSTTIGILQHPSLKQKLGLEPFDYLILDEASKTTFSEFLVPALYARRWVVVGDRRQLSPFVDETDLAVNVRNLVPQNVANAAMYGFRASASVSKKSSSTLMLLESPEQRQLMIEEANARDVPAIDLDTRDLSLPCFELAGAELVCASGKTLQAWENRLPGDLIPSNDALPPLPDWEAHRSSYPQLPEKFQEALIWADEIAWRQIRAYELRQNPDEQQYLLDELDALLPKGKTAQQGTPNLGENLKQMRRVAMTSILEILQVGAGCLPDWDQQTVLTHGLPAQALEQRSVSLTFQHRMHPDISAFPRDQFYAEDNLLNDSSSLERDWNYKHYGRRAVWLDIAPRQQKKGGRAQGNRNPAEADHLINELSQFVQWAEHEPRTGKDAGKPWKVAALTFYKGQEHELRIRLQAMSKQRANTRQFSLGNGRIEVSLCTVDRFQGHEADLVLLSFVKSGSAGFLNSPNRLNVALTRARYQLVLIGHRFWMSSKSCRSGLLRNLAASTRYAKNLGWDIP
ncbi:AAA domain-containing protein [Pectobacterium colocasium]|uniref:AAA domain-containing protein n=1 Tax=Pectobacterium TaxID=122277 RepID=UPI003D761BC9